MSIFRISRHTAKLKNQIETTTLSQQDTNISSKTVETKPDDDQIVGIPISDQSSQQPRESESVTSGSSSSSVSESQSQDSISKPFTREPGGSQVPVAGALFIATCLGSPVCVLAGLKLGMFAAVAGGIMGYTTGKMFAEHE